MSVKLQLNVFCQTHLPEEIVCVTGSSPELGSWNLSRAIQMVNVGRNFWSTNIRISHDVQVLYRYCICVLASGVGTPSKMMVRKWETDIQARQIIPGQLKSVDDFGKISSVYNVQDGCLTHQESFLRIFLRIFLSQVYTSVRSTEATYTNSKILNALNEPLGWNLL